MQKPIKRITPFSLKPLEYISELVYYRNLIWILTKREFGIQFAQTYLGWLWVLVRPIFTLVVFTLIFKLFLKVPTPVPYYLFAFTGMIVWNLFAQIASGSSAAVQHNQIIIRKMYFPRLILLFSRTLIALAEAIVMLVVVIIMLLVEGMAISYPILLLPFFIALNTICGLAISVWMNTLNIRFRDINQLLPGLLSVGVWLTPVFYPTTIIPDRFSFLLNLNPLTAIVGGYRYALFGGQMPTPASFISVTVFVAIFIAGILYFISIEDEMTDYA